MEKLAQLEEWAVKRWKEPNDQIERADFVHLVGAGTVPAATLATWVAPVDYKSIIREAYEESLNHAEALITQGPQRYALRVFRASNPRRPLGQFLWTIDHPDGAVGATDTLTESPNATGLLQIAMRGMKDANASAAGAWKDIFNIQKQEIASLREQVATLQNARAEMWDMAEALNQKTHERQIEHMKATGAEARKAEMLGVFKLIAPTIGTRVAKHFGIMTPSADVVALDQVFASFTEEQFDGINAILSVPQRIALLELLKKREAATRPPGEAAPASTATDASGPKKGETVQ